MAPLSALLVDMEATELREQLPSLVDAFFDVPILATWVEMLCNDVLQCAARRNDEDRWILDGSVLGIRVGAWRKVAQDALGVTE